MPSSARWPIRSGRSYLCCGASPHRCLRFATRGLGEAARPPHVCGCGALCRQNSAKCVDKAKHFVLETVHPSPLSGTSSWEVSCLVGGVGAPRSCHGVFDCTRSDRVLVCSHWTYLRCLSSYAWLYGLQTLLQGQRVLVVQGVGADRLERVSDFQSASTGRVVGSVWQCASRCTSRTEMQ